MANLNKVLLIGNLTKDPELRYTQSGAAICDVRMAVNRRFLGQNGETRDETCFVQVTIFGKRGEAFSRFFQKGKPAFIEGRLRYDEWEDKQSGQKRSKLSIVAEDWQFVGPAPQENRAGRKESSGEAQSFSDQASPEAEFSSEETPF